MVTIAKADVVLRINADHARAAAFLIHDGVVPSNEGRGYVLRKIMRRALRNARRIGVVDPYFHKLTNFVAEFMKPAYPELLESTGRVARIVKEEEYRYATTYQVAERVFHDEAKRAVGGVLPGPAAFKLYDTYGLAADEQEDMAREFGLSIDKDGFEAEMDKQRERARASWKGADKTQVSPIYGQLQTKFGRTKFTGYDNMTQDNCKVLAILVDQREVDSVAPGATAEVVLDTTCFYAESGGQVGDHGEFQTKSGDTVATVQNTYPAGSRAFCTQNHRCNRNQEGRYCSRRREQRSALRHSPESHRDASAACGPPQCSGRSCEAGRFGASILAASGSISATTRE